MTLTPPPANGQIERLLRVTEDQARATGAIAELQRSNVETLGDIRDSLARHTPVLEKMCGTLERIEEDQKDGRERAVAVVLAKVEERTKSGGWVVVVGWAIAASATVLAAALTAHALLMKR